MLNINIFDLLTKKRLWFAERGSSLKEKILKIISENNEKDVVKIDLDKIEVTDASFAREGFVKLIADISMDQNRPQILFINVDKYVEHNLYLSLKEHKKFALIVNKNNERKLIGKFTQQTSDTLKTLIECKEASTSELAKKMDIGLTTCNNRLINLYEMCVITRREVGQKSGGIEYIYKISI